MNKNVKKQWVQALRSGDFKQGHNALRFNDRFCCLGVLCEIAVRAEVIEAKKRGDHEWAYAGNVGLLPVDVMTWAGMDTWNPRVTICGVEEGLARHNDAGRTFAQIADAIEEQL